LTGGLDLDDLEILRVGNRLRDERLRMLTVGSRVSWRQGRSTQYLASLDLVHGLDALGSGLTALDLAQDPRSADFTLTRLSFTRFASIGANWSVRLDALAQQTASTLPFGERFKIGGDRLGRGFEVAEIAGDQGLGAKVEVRRNLANAPPRLRGAALYGFYDLGAAWKQDVSGRESAATAGLGLSIQANRVSSMIELAKPLTHPDVEGRKKLALFAELALSF
jgi:hemolysin activation/secretion protein